MKSERQTLSPINHPVDRLCEYTISLLSFLVDIMLPWLKATDTSSLEG